MHGDPDPNKRIQFYHQVFVVDDLEQPDCKLVELGREMYIPQVNHGNQWKHSWETHGIQKTRCLLPHCIFRNKPKRPWFDSAS